MNNLLKEAIADAKAVRETALANAKLALEEAFTPRLQSMLSAKLSEEEEMEEGMREDEMDMPMDEPAPEMPAEEPAPEMEEMRGDDMEEGGMREDEETHDEGMHEDEDDMEEGHHEMDEMRDDEPVAEEDDLELEAIIKELEDEIEEDEHELDENSNDVGAEEDGAAVSESNDVSSGIGTTDNKAPAAAATGADTDDSEGTGVKVVSE